MALPTICFNSSTGSDTAASGAGPATALSGTGAALAASTTVTLSVDSPDLSGVATDGSAVCWVDSSSGRQYSRITAVDNVLKTVTVATAYGVTEGSRAWGIGGKRATLDHADSRTLGADIEAGWIVEIENDGAGAITGTAWTISASAACTIRGNSLTTKRLLTQSANASVLSFTGAASYDVQNLIFENTNGTKTSANGISGNTSTLTVRVRNCRFGHSTNTLIRGVDRIGGAPAYQIHDSEFQFCTGAGVQGRTKTVVIGCYIHDNGASGVVSGGAATSFIVRDCVIEANTGDGILINGTPSSVIDISGNTINANSGDGLDTSVGIQGNMTIYNNNFTANGNYGIRVASGDNPAFVDFNNYGTGATANTSGSMLNLTAGANDLAVDPSYTDAANGNFAARTAIKAKGFPLGTRRIGGDPSAGTYGFYDIGIQREEPATKLVNNSLVN